jgi:hypothetical protein
MLDKAIHTFLETFQAGMVVKCSANLVCCRKSIAARRAERLPLLINSIYCVVGDRFSLQLGMQFWIRYERT